MQSIAKDIDGVFQQYENDYPERSVFEDILTKKLEQDKFNINADHK